MKPSNIFIFRKTLNYLTLLMLTSMLACDTVHAEEELIYSQIPDEIEYISIKELKHSFPTDSVSYKIIEDIFLKVKVTANDVSGNIYKKLYIADETGGIYLALDQNYLSTLYPIGSIIHIHLKDLYLIKKWSLVFIGHPTTKNNLLPKDLMKTHIKIISKDKNTTLKPEIKQICELTQEDECKLITIKNALFKHQGNSIFYDDTLAKSNYTNQYLNDGTGEVILPVSKYFRSIQGKNIPITQGNITGIATKFGSRWQIIIRDLNDINFPEDEHIIIPKNTITNPLFFEDFGIPQKSNYNWPKLKEYRHFREKSPIVYKDKTNDLSIMVKNNQSCLWFPDDRLATLEIDGLKIKNHNELTLEIDIVFGNESNPNDVKMEVLSNNKLINPEYYHYLNQKLTIKLNNLIELRNLKIRPKINEEFNGLAISSIVIY